MAFYGPVRLVGFSDTPTLYRMILPERGDVYVKCGADILINGLTTDLRAEVTRKTASQSGYQSTPENLD